MNLLAVLPDRKLFACLEQLWIFPASKLVIVALFEMFLRLGKIVVLGVSGFGVACCLGS